MITAEKLRELLDYDAESGIFTRRVRRGPYAAGGIAGSTRKSDGYVAIMIDGREYQAHRLAWLYVHGEWPKNECDHKNGVRNDNRLDNLRDVTASVNSQNRRKASSLSSTGLLGVFMNRGLPRARIQVPGGRRIDLGRFATPELAHAAYLDAKRKLHEGNLL